MPRLRSIAELLKITDPPAMVRLEPDSTTGDPKPGTEARVADPAWMLGRQWQFGELIGEDAGSVVSVRVRSQALPVTGWAPLDDATVKQYRRRRVATVAGRSGSRGVGAGRATPRIRTRGAAARRSRPAARGSAGRCRCRSARRGRSRPAIRSSLEPAVNAAEAALDPQAPRLLASARRRGPRWRRDRRRRCRVSRPPTPTGSTGADDPGRSSRGAR